MKRWLFALLLTSFAVPALADVGVSINIGEPNFYGVINIGDFPQPRVVYARPVLVERVAVVEQPLYLRVPPGHAKHWSRHCREYDACGRRVYFVQDRWYNDVYVPRYRERYEHREDRRDDRYERREDRRDERSERHEDRRDERSEERHDRGHGHDDDDDHDHGHKH